jgi:hypothetical protein
MGAEQFFRRLLMAISGPASYVPTTEEFISHWGLADTALGAGNEIVLAGAVNLAALTTKKTALVTKRTLLQTKLTELEVARGDIDVRKGTLLELFAKFTDRVRSLYAGTKYARALPMQPGPNDSLGVFTDPMDSAASLWKLINDDAALPDILIMGTTQAQFVTQIADLKTAYTTRTNAVTVADVTREERNDLQDAIYAILKNYRQALPTYFATGHALVDSLPKLTPEPGSTPEAVTLTAEYVPATGQVRITVTRSPATDFAEYEYRMTRGPVWSDADDEVIGNVSNQDTLEFLTDKGVETAGVSAVYRAFVKTTTGNEKGSNTVLITRP